MTFDAQKIMSRRHRGRPCAFGGVEPGARESLGVSRTAAPRPLHI